MDYSIHTFYQKKMAWLYIIVLALGTVAGAFIPKQENAEAAQKSLVIPDEAIRLRILANSDSEKDQEVKRAIRDAVNLEITKWVEELTSIEEARDIISSRLPAIEEIARAEMAKMNMAHSVKVEFGDVPFPAKLYGELYYPAGTYEAILITLGEGGGANWWCVLFPPLCFIDVSNSVAVSPGFEEQEKEIHNVDNREEKIQSSTYAAEPENEVEVKFFLKELLGKLF